MVALFQKFLCDLRKFLTDVAGKPVMNAAGVYAGYIGHNHRRRRGNGHNQPHDNKEEAPGQGDQFQYLSVARGVVTDSAEGDQKHDGGNGGNHHEADVDGAMKDLASTAMVAFAKVLLVVASHLRRDARNVETPPGQNISDHLICTSTHRKLSKEASSE